MGADSKPSVSSGPKQGGQQPQGGWGIALMAAGLVCLVAAVMLGLLLLPQNSRLNGQNEPVVVLQWDTAASEHMSIADEVRFLVHVTHSHR